MTKIPAPKAAFYKAQDGSVWFLGIYSNNFEDREEEILSWGAHKEYAEWFNSNKLKLPIIMMHQPQFPGYFHMLHTYATEKFGILSPQEYAENIRKLYKSTTIATAERIIPLNGFAIVVGKVREDRYDMLEKFSGLWGMSHGFIKFKQNGNIINKYRTFEFTLAPSELAANTITLIGFLNKENSMADEKLTTEERELLESFLKGSSDDLEEATKEAREILSRVFNSKTLDEVTESDADAEEEEPENDETTDYEVLRGKLFNDLDVSGLSNALQHIGEALQQHNKKFAELEKVLSKTDDERVAEYISPDWKVFYADHKTEGENDQELLDDLKEKAGEKISDEGENSHKDNPLSQGFWRRAWQGD